MYHIRPVIKEEIMLEMSWKFPPMCGWILDLSWTYIDISKKVRHLKVVVMWQPLYHHRLG